MRVTTFCAYNKYNKFVKLYYLKQGLFVNVWIELSRKTQWRQLFLLIEKVRNFATVRGKSVIHKEEKVKESASQQWNYGTWRWTASMHAAL